MSLFAKLEKCYRPLLATAESPFKFHSFKRLHEHLEILQKIARAEQVAEHELAMLETALGLHFASQWENNLAPEKGLALAQKRLKGKLEESELPELAAAANLVTEARQPEPHTSSLVLILLDTLTAFYADPKFEKRLRAYYSELDRTSASGMEGDIWYRGIAKQMQHHRYATPFAQATFDRGKSENLSKFKKMLKKRSRRMDETLAQSMKVDERELLQLKKKLAKVQNVPERGTETWYRLASTNLYTRRQIVDKKSGILLAVNAIMLAIVLGGLYPFLADDPNLAYALGPLVLTNLLSIAFAIFATRPKLNPGRQERDAVEKKTASLMTFDDFYNMTQAEFEWAVEQATHDRSFLYGTIKRDMYRLGVDLAKRYKHIQIAYHVFLVGIIISVIMFGLCHLIF